MREDGDANPRGAAGVHVTEADPATKVVRIRFEESTVGPDQVREALDEVGFSPED